MFLANGGALPNVAGPGVAYPLGHPLDRPGYSLICNIFDSSVLRFNLF